MRIIGDSYKCAHSASILQPGFCRSVVHLVATESIMRKLRTYTVLYSVKELSRGGSSRSERNETLMIEYIYLFICMHNVKLSPVCLSVILSTRSLNSEPTPAQFCYQRLYRCGLGYSSVALQLIAYRGLPAIMSHRLTSCIYIWIA